MHTYIQIYSLQHQNYVTNLKAVLLITHDLSRGYSIIPFVKCFVFSIGFYRYALSIYMCTYNSTHIFYIIYAHVHRPMHKNIDVFILSLVLNTNFPIHMPASEGLSTRFWNTLFWMNLKLCSHPIYSFFSELNNNLLIPTFKNFTHGINYLHPLIFFREKEISHRNWLWLIVLILLF